MAKDPVRLSWTIGVGGDAAFSGIGVRPTTESSLT